MFLRVIDENSVMKDENIYDDIKPFLIISKILGKTNLNIASFGKFKFEWGIHCAWPFVSTKLKILNISRSYYRKMVFPF